MPLEGFEKQKRAVINKLLEKPKNMNQETNRYWNCITGLRFDFQQNANDAEKVALLTLNDLIEFYNQYIFQSPSRRKLSMHLYSQKVLFPDTALAITQDTVDQFKASASLTRPVVPVHPIQHWFALP